MKYFITKNFENSILKLVFGKLFLMPKIRGE